MYLLEKWLFTHAINLNFWKPILIWIKEVCVLFMILFKRVSVSLIWTYRWTLCVIIGCYRWILFDAYLCFDTRHVYVNSV